MSAGSGRGSMGDERELRTRVAMQALDFAGAFASVVGHIRIAPANYVPELMKPEGPSTRGGSLAMQRIRLVPTSDKYPTLVVGSVNVKSGQAELRAYDYVDAVHRQHFGKPVQLDRAAYEDFLRTVSEYLGVAQFKVVIESPPGEVAAAKSRVSPLAVGFVVVAALSAIAAIAYYFTH